ncbi:MAG TPA: type II and III secretion system protein family protein [Stellaceae bacterium]|jgi:pilus assembly protein CpaC|nr:type II and III secretion system protein family protein [Stellaceae bacterium]
MIRRLNVVRTIALALALAFAAIPAPLLWASQVVSPTGAPITLDVSKGVIIRLDRPCSSVFVADPDIADVQLKSPTVLYVMGKGAGSTTIYAVDQQDAVLLNSRIEVHQDIDRLTRDLRAIDPSGHVRAKAVDDSIVLEGTIKDAAQGDDIRKLAARYVANPTQLVNRLKLDAPNQVQLQVRVAEVQRNVLKQFGVNWFNVEQSGVAAFGMVSATNAIAPNAANAGAGAVSKIVPPLAGASLSTANPTSCCAFNTPTSTMIGSATNNNFTASYKNGDFLINSVVDALAQNGLVTILAEPTLVTVSGQKASFLAGGEFPIPIAQSGSGNSAAITIDWKQFGVSINFTPTVMGDGRIALHVAPEVSELAPTAGITIQGVNVPGITTRRADTTVELGSGQTFAIAGLLQNQTQQQLQSYPWIGDLPVIGALFRSTAFQRGETELVILVTPYMVQPVSSATALVTDNDGFYAPTDRDRVMNGNLNSVPSHDPGPGKPAASASPGSAIADGATPAPRRPVPAPVALPAPAVAAPMSGTASAAPMNPASLAPTVATAVPVALPAPKAAAASTRSAATSGFEID